MSDHYPGDDEATQDSSTPSPAASVPPDPPEAWAPSASPADVPGGHGTEPQTTHPAVSTGARDDEPTDRVPSSPSSPEPAIAPPAPWWAVTAGSPRPASAPESPAPLAPAAPALAGRPRRRGRLAVAAMVLVAALLGGLVGGGIVAWRDDDHTTTSPTADQAIPASASRDTLPPAPIGGNGESIRTILARVRPGVVRVNVVLNRGGLFGGTSEGGGTGFIVSSDGYIVTNAHVVDGAQSIKVTLSNGDAVSARVTGVQTDRDLAVVKIDRTGLSPVTLGDSDVMQVGDAVVAIGNALDLQGELTVTQGIVSALNRQIQEENGNTLVDMIQTDAAINPGNSGGPLINARGEVIGINTAIASPQDSNNVGFAIAISSAKPIISSLEHGRSAAVPYLGVEPVDVTPTLVTAQHLAVKSGAYVSTVRSDGPAGSAGVKKGDVIVRFDGETVQSAADLRRLIRRHEPGDRVTVVVNRGGTEHSLDVKLVPFPTDPGQ
jgi:S1-C subfamily serine protease